MHPIEQIYGRALQSPSHIAFASRSLQLSSSELVDLAQRLAARLKQLGVARGSVVGIRASPEVEAIATLSILQLGGISMSRPATGWSELRKRIDLVVVTEHDFDFPLSKQVVIDGTFVSYLSAIPPLKDIEPTEAEDLCRVVFSSGTTGVPKGVPFSLSALTSRVDSAEGNWIQLKPFMCLLGPETVSGYQTFMWSLLKGHTYLSPSDGANNLRLLEMFHVRSIKTSPARLKDLLTQIEKTPTTSLKLEEIQVAGSILSKQVAQKCLDLLSIQPTYLYGSSEVGTVSRGVFNTQNPRNVGRVVGDIELEVLGDEGKQVPVGETGIIRCRREGLPDSYWPAGSGESLRGGWFYPGDVGRLDTDGTLHIDGRSDDVINNDGAKLNLSHLDQILEETGLFDEVATFVTTSQEGEMGLGLAFVPAHNTTPQFLVEKLTKLLPSIHFTSLAKYSTLPRNSLGKISRRDLGKPPRSKGLSP